MSAPGIHIRLPPWLPGTCVSDSRMPRHPRGTEDYCARRRRPSVWGNLEPFPCVQRAPRADEESAQLLRGGATMKRVALVALVLAAIIPLPVAADDALVRFEGGIGVHPVSNVSGTANTDGSFPNVTRNVVRGINPAGQLWVIADLKAAVKTDGSIRVNGRGLLRRLRSSSAAPISRVSLSSQTPTSRSTTSCRRPRVDARVPSCSSVAPAI